MDLIYLFRRLVFAQVMLGVVAFCMAERNPGMLLVAGAIGTLSWYVAEGPAGRPLPQWAIHLGAIAAVAWLTWEIRYYYGHAGPREINTGMIIAMGHFTMWLQVLQLYGRKTNREYALILVLGLMQMIGASVLSVRMEYGLLLAAYCILALFTVLLFQFKTISDQVHEATQKAALEPNQVVRGQPVAGRGHRWQFRLTAAFVGLGCAVVAVAVFIGVPRSPETPLQVGFGQFGESQVGFSPQVKLREGAIKSDNHAAVLKLTLTRDGRPEREGAAIGMLLRGNANDEYDVINHVWRRSGSVSVHDRHITLDPSGYRLAPEGASATRVAEITLRHAPAGLLFAPFPPLHVEASNVRHMAFNPYDQHLAIDSAILAERGHGGYRGGAVEYRIHFEDADASGMLESEYLKRLPAVDRSRARPFSRWRRRHRREPSEIGAGWYVQPDRFRAKAEQILRDAGLDDALDEEGEVDDERIARALEHYLQTSRDYAYSLDIPASPGQDPVAAFLFDHKRGHCELFASALAAMARSIGMRARVVTGYRVSEFNTIGNYYVVRESNAHAWTEIYCEEQGWLTFDATPPGNVAIEHARDDSIFSVLSEFYEHLEFTWISAFVSYDERTRSKLFTGINESFKRAAHDEKSLIGKVVAFFVNIREAWRLERVTYLFMAGISVFILIGVVSLARTLIKRHRRLVALQLTALPRPKRRGLARRLRFYLIMLDMLERHGYSRPRWQSPFDFAQHLARDNSHRFEPVVHLTEVFYEIRFGHRPLDGDRKARVRANMRRLEDTLAGREPAPADAPAS